MSQQEFVPRSQQGSEQTDGGQYKQYYQPRTTGDILKEEHPSTYDEDIPAYSYRAQDLPRGTQAAPRSSAQHKRYTHHFSPDGDALENGYRPYRNGQAHHRFFYWQPQRVRHRPSLMRILFTIGLILLAIKILPELLIVAATIIGTAVAVMLVATLAVLAVVGVVVAVVLFLLSALGFPISRFRNAGRNWYWR